MSYGGISFLDKRARRTASIVDPLVKLGYMRSYISYIAYCITGRQHITGDPYNIHGQRYTSGKRPQSHEIL
jgi:hypothetical protein